MSYNNYITCCRVPSSSLTAPLTPAPFQSTSRRRRAAVSCCRGHYPARTATRRVATPSPPPLTAPATDRGWRAADTTPGPRPGPRIRPTTASGPPTPSSATVRPTRRTAATTPTRPPATAPRGTVPLGQPRPVAWREARRTCRRSERWTSPGWSPRPRGRGCFRRGRLAVVRRSPSVTMTRTITLGEWKRTV